MFNFPQVTQLFMTAFTVLAFANTGRAAVITYIDEGDYLAALGGMGLSAVHEGFENDSVWGSVRSTIVGGNMIAPSITSQGITWTSNNAISSVTTSHGAAVAGDWGFYSLAHGRFTLPSNPDHANDVPDGFGGSLAETLFGVGGWISTNTPFAGISLFLDSAPVDFGDLPGGGDPELVTTAPAFWGVIDTNGFNAFLWQETEGTWDDQKFIFSDDFTFAVASATIPEPSSLILLGVCSLSLLGYSCFRRKLMSKDAGNAPRVQQNG